MRHKLIASVSLALVEQAIKVLGEMDAGMALAGTLVVMMTRHHLAASMTVDQVGSYFSQAQTTEAPHVH